MQVKNARRAVAKNTKKALSLREIKASYIANQQYGVSESTVRRVQKASVTGYDPKLSTLVKLSNTLGVDLGELVTNITGIKKVKTKQVTKAPKIVPYPGHIGNV